MSDLELLDLLDRAKQNNRGPQGEAGIGITEINQADDKSFTVVLSNGRTFPISSSRAQGGVRTGHRAAMVNVALRALLDAQEHRAAQLQADRAMLDLLEEMGQGREQPFLLTEIC